MCGETVVVPLPPAPAGPARGRRRRRRHRCGYSGDERTVQVFEDEFRSYCEWEKTTTLPVLLLAPAATDVRAKKPRCNNSATTGETATENATGSKKSGGGRTPAKQSKHGFRGVHRRTYGRWSAEIRDPVKGCRVWLGTYDTVEEAARVYDVEARKIYGPNAKTNLPPPVAAADDHLPAAAPPVEKIMKASSSRAPKTRCIARPSGHDSTAAAHAQQRPLVATAGGAGANKHRGQRATTNKCGGKTSRRRPPASNGRGSTGMYGRWAAGTRDGINGCCVCIGTYDTPEAATHAAAYDADAARGLYGCDATRTNIPAPAVEQAEAKKTTKPPPATPAALDMASPCAGELGSVLAALEITDGWEFEPYSRGLGLLAGADQLIVVYADEHDDELEGGETACNATDGGLWSFF